MPLLTHGSARFWLGYSTNVHPGETVGEVILSLERTTALVRAQVCPDRIMGIGLWLSAAAAAELVAHAEELARLRDALARHGLQCFTLNGFPAGGFHARRVKEAVFRPGWDDPARLRYTRDLAAVLAALIGEGETGSVSTVAGGFRPATESPAARDAIAANLLEAAAHLHRVRQETGRTIVLGLEPEPFSTLETTDDVVPFFRERLFRGARTQLSYALGMAGADAEGVAREHLGICFDACHQAVQGEDLGASLRRLASEGVRIAKLQVTSALEVPSPATNGEGVAALRAFAEERYLHQVVARTPRGRALRALDLPDVFAGEAPRPEWLAAPAWRCHFHVPVHASAPAPLATTQRDLVDALGVVVRGRLTPHLEVETYTWGVLPEHAGRAAAEGGSALAAGLASEMRWTLERLAEIGCAVSE